MKTYLHTFFLIFICLFYLTPEISSAQEPTFNYKKDAKVSSQIERFLCAPTPSDLENRNAGVVTFDPNVAAFNNSASGDLYKCINRLYRFAIAIGSSVSIFMIVVAGYLYMSSDGNEEAVTKAKDILVSSCTGLVILFIGYILLRAINPDLIAFKNIQPPSVVLPSSDWASWRPNLDSTGRIASIESPAGKFLPIGANDPNLIKAAGCGFQDPLRFEAEIKGIQTSLFNAIIKICEAASPKGKIQISSVASGKHNPNSWHYKFCAVDLADGTGAFRNSEAGKVAEATARALIPQIPGLRVNPGDDINSSTHLHIDISTTCQEKKG